VALDRSKVLETAQKHLAKGNFDKAIAEYQRLVKEDPSDVRTWLKIGDLFTRKGARREACQTYLRVAQHYGEQGFLPKAVAVYKQILKLDPTRLDISIKLAEAYQHLEMTTEASAAYEHVAGALARAGQVDKALAVLKKMVELDPENITARIKLAEALSKAGKAPQAAAEFAAGATLLEAQGRVDDYIKVAERLLFHRPGDVKTARKLAAFYLERDDAKRALAKLQLCFKADPRDVATLELLARAFHVLGQTPKTISVYREAARILADQGKEDERARVLKRILELDPEDQEARQALAAYAERSSARLSPASADASGARSAPVAEEAEIEELEVDDADIVVMEDEDEPEPELEVVEERMSAAPAEEPAPRESGPAPARMSEPAADARASVPPDVAREAQIARLLTECDVFLRYGLKNKVVNQLSRVLELDPGHVEARERLKDLYVDMGHTEQAIAQLHALADVFETERPDVTEQYLQQVLALAPDDALARQRLAAASGGATSAAPDADLDAFEGAEEEVVFIDESLAPPPDEETMALLDEPERPEDFEEVPTGQVEALPEVEDVPEPEVVQVDDSGREPRWAMQPPAPAAGEPETEPDLTATQAVVPAPEVVPAPAVVPAPDEDDPFAPESPEDFDAEPAAAAAPAPAPAAADAGGGEVEEILDEAEFFLAQSMYDEARSSLNDALQEFPDHPLLLDKLREIDEAEGGGEGDLAVEEPTDQSFELAEKLAEELGETAEADDDQIDVETVFAQFKKGVAETVGSDDIETHFDLGIAYKEMGLIDDAIGEFVLCTGNPERECMAHTMIGLCHVEKGTLAEAIEHFKKGLYAEEKGEREELGLYFELGHAYELLNDGNEALYYYEKVKKRDPNFRGVDDRIRALSQSNTKAPEPTAGGGLDDVDRAFDDLLRDD
jgi:pilus assembly protein FimV